MSPSAANVRRLPAAAPREEEVDGGLVPPVEGLLERRPAPLAVAIDHGHRDPSSFRIARRLSTPLAAIRGPVSSAPWAARRSTSDSRVSTGGMVRTRHWRSVGWDRLRPWAVASSGRPRARRPGRRHRPPPGSVVPGGNARPSPSSSEGPLSVPRLSRIDSGRKRSSYFHRLNDLEDRNLRIPTSPRLGLPAFITGLLRPIEPRDDIDSRGNSRVLNYGIPGAIIRLKKNPPAACSGRRPTVPGPRRPGMIDQAALAAVPEFPPDALRVCDLSSDESVRAIHGPDCVATHGTVAPAAARAPSLQESRA